jgi:hypothetical protein
LSIAGGDSHIQDGGITDAHFNADYRTRHSDFSVQNHAEWRAFWLYHLAQSKARSASLAAGATSAQKSGVQFY